MVQKRLTDSFFQRDVLQVAPELLGKILVRCVDGVETRYRITEVEAYKGGEDLACHASKGRTPRTDVMFHAGGKIYVYLIYGMYWMLNFVTEKEDEPSAVLIRGIEGFSGPGKVGRELLLDKSFYAELLETSSRLWVEDAPAVGTYQTGPRIGVDYAGEVWANMPWRFFIDSK